MHEPNRSILSLLVYFIQLVFTIPLKRLFGNKPACQSWSIRTEISIMYLRRMLDNNLEASRNNENRVAKFVNSAIKDELQHVSHNGFKGVWIGPESSEKSDPIIFYLHGGGYSLCTAMTYIASLSKLIEIFKTKGKVVRVFSLDYSLAPECKYPTQLNEAVEAFKYVVDHCANRPIFLMGDSAGGNLALSLLLELQNSELKKHITGCILISPWVNMSNPPMSIQNEQTDFLALKELQSHVTRFVPKEMTTQDPKISPGLAPSFQGFPLTFVHYGGKEFFMGDIEVFIQRLKADKVHVTEFREESAPHITPMLIPFFPSLAKVGLDAIAQFVCKV